MVAVWSKLLTGIAQLRPAKKPASEGTEAAKEGHLAISTLAHVGGASTRTSRRGAAVFATDFATQLSGSGCQTLGPVGTTKRKKPIRSTLAGIGWDGSGPPSRSAKPRTPVQFRAWPPALSGIGKDPRQPNVNRSPLVRLSRPSLVGAAKISPWCRDLLWPDG